MLVTAIHPVSQGGQQLVAEHVLYLALPLGFSLLAVGLLLWTWSLWAAVGVHGELVACDRGSAGGYCSHVEGQGAEAWEVMA